MKFILILYFYLTQDIQTILFQHVIKNLERYFIFCCCCWRGTKSWKLLARNRQSNALDFNPHPQGFSLHQTCQMPSEKPRLSPSGLFVLFWEEGATTHPTTRGPREEGSEVIAIPPGSGSFCRRRSRPCSAPLQQGGPGVQFQLTKGRVSTVRRKWQARRNSVCIAYLQLLVPGWPLAPLHGQGGGPWGVPDHDTPWWPSHAGLRPTQRESPAPSSHNSGYSISGLHVDTCAGPGRKKYPPVGLKQGII